MNSLLKCDYQAKLKSYSIILGQNFPGCFNHCKFYEDGKSEKESALWIVLSFLKREYLPLFGPRRYCVPARTYLTVQPYNRLWPFHERFRKRLATLDGLNAHTEQDKRPETFAKSRSRSKNDRTTIKPLDNRFLNFRLIFVLFIRFSLS